MLRTLVQGGIEVCFANPGTTELDLIRSLERVPELRPVLGLFEGVCTGAADGYARMAAKPAATLLHLGPGLSNGLANLHNARRASSAVVNIVGDHATYHLANDPPLASDIVSLARPVSDWVHTVASAAALPQAAGAAVAAARRPPGQVATLIVPADCTWGESSGPASVGEWPAPTRVAQATVGRVAGILEEAKPSVLLLGGPALMEEGLALAGRVARASGARLLAKRASARLQRGAGRAVVQRLPYFPHQVLGSLEEVAHLILVAAPSPVAFFAYPDTPTSLVPEGCQVHVLARPEEDVLGALAELAAWLDAPARPAATYELRRPGQPTGSLDAAKVWQSVAALMPEGAIVCDESITSGRDGEKLTAGAPPHDWLSLTGGSIGQGMPLALGAAVACPDRQVISMQADGSGMYTLQALWTQAREKANVLTVLFSNRAYNILGLELHRRSVDNPGPAISGLVGLDCPALDWVSIANGLGVPAARATTAEEFNRILPAALEEPGPFLIEAQVPSGPTRTNAGSSQRAGATTP